MELESLTRLRRLAHAMHEAIREAANTRDLPGNLSGFPEECCNYNLWFLGSLLFDHGFRDIREYSGCRPDGDSSSEHHWISVEGVIVDITAYQFDPELEKVIVDENSSWHDELAGREVQIGLTGETLAEYFARTNPARNSYMNGLLDDLKSQANRSLEIRG